MKIGIVGNGFVGKATSLLACEAVEVLTYDKDPNRREPKDLILKDLASCDFVFVCVPTPMRKDSSCDLSIVRAVVSDLTTNGVSKRNIVIRSTVPVGTSKELNVHFMPEFLTEANWTNDVRENNVWVMGVRDAKDFHIQRQFHNLICLAKEAGRVNSDRVSFCSTGEAELAKYARNCFLATKVSFFNELHQFCKSKRIDFEQVRQLVALDKRIDEHHTSVPGPDGKHGFGGTCFPKDMNSLSCQCKGAGMIPHVIDAAIYRNENVDRTEKDWFLDKGRAVSD